MENLKLATGRQKMLNSLKKLTKKVWYDDLLWDVVEVISPTPYDHYLLLKREMENEIHKDGITPVDMILLDTGSYEFYPNTRRVRGIMKERKIVRERQREQQAVQRRILTNAWLACFKDDG